MQDFTCVIRKIEQAFRQLWDTDPFRQGHRRGEREEVQGPDSSSSVSGRR